MSEITAYSKMPSMKSSMSIQAFSMALEQLKDIPKQTKNEMLEVFESESIDSLQELIDYPWTEPILEYLPDLIEIIKAIV